MYQLFRFVPFEKASQVCADETVGQAQLLSRIVSKFRIDVKHARIGAARDDGEFGSRNSILLQDVPTEGTRYNDHMIDMLDDPFLQQFQGAARPVSTLAEENVFLGDPAVVIEDNLVSIERPGRECEGSGIEFVRVNHANGLLSGKDAHLHEEPDDLGAGNCRVGGTVLQFKLFGMTVEEE